MRAELQLSRVDLLLIFCIIRRVGWPVQFVIAAQGKVGKTAPHLQHNAV
jgi:hypothetical protein